jgi:hypothetical protein
LIVSELNNGQPLSQPDRSKPRRHNAKRCRLPERHAIILALANYESVESIRRKYRVSRHKVLAIRDQYPHEIEAAQKRIKELIEGHYLDAQIKAFRLIACKMDTSTPTSELIKISNWIDDRMLALETPVQANPYPLSIKLAALRRAKRNGLPVPSR